ncbi:MAG: hypothetical protein U5L72_10505 [Bacteroidales bacterium]|nr:hypothetical protein [Bacteroidales bacterium]
MTARSNMFYEEAEPLLTANPDISSELSIGMEELDSLSAQIIRDLHDNIASQEILKSPDNQLQAPHRTDAGYALDNEEE